MPDMSTGDGAATNPGELVVVRHGESTWNRDHLFQGQADPPLSALGRRQAAELAERFRTTGLRAVATSDLARAHETGAIVAAELGLDLPVVLPDLRERWSRTLTGLHRDEIEARFPGSVEAWRDGASTELVGDTEPYDVFATRVLAGLRAASELASAVLVVCHGGLFRVLHQVCGTDLRAGVANAAGRRLLVEAGRLVDAGDAFRPEGTPATGAEDL
ncbi:MAG: hypothetical protein AVDCRST_MAG72-2262 [uncultured Nocardioidaceae bacterium]|uniref:Phosphoglycerate mutase n=1 Tax=uncultured Nocardioidaceae bacterium TaxID=253824 RepID=A0A6J4MM47_9ACTN|nr:MAG: hypothetical protein AVDCRST_MAG72-2262 [uncultured Nocardioidaceae bacterium]